MLPFKYNDVRQVRISKTILEAEALPLRITPINVIGVTLEIAYFATVKIKNNKEK